MANIQVVVGETRVVVGSHGIFFSWGLVLQLLVGLFWVLAAIWFGRNGLPWGRGGPLRRPAREEPVENDAGTGSRPDDPFLHIGLPVSAWMQLSVPDLQRGLEDRRMTKGGTKLELARRLARADGVGRPMEDASSPGWQIIYETETSEQLRRRCVAHGLTAQGLREGVLQRLLSFEEGQRSAGEPMEVLFARAYHSRAHDGSVFAPPAPVVPAGPIPVVAPPAYPLGQCGYCMDPRPDHLGGDCPWARPETRRLHEKPSDRQKGYIQGSAKRTGTVIPPIVYQSKAAAGRWLDLYGDGPRVSQLRP